MKVRRVKGLTSNVTDQLEWLSDNLRATSSELDKIVAELRHENDQRITHTEHEGKNGRG